MSTQPVNFISPDEYLELERKAEFKSEYFDGQIFVEQMHDCGNAAGRLFGSAVKSERHCHAVIDLDRASRLWWGRASFRDVRRTPPKAPNL